MSLFNKCVHSLQYIYSKICTETPNGRNSIRRLQGATLKIRNDIDTHTQTHTCYSLHIKMLRINDIMILKKQKKFHLISLKMIYTVVVHTRIQYMIIKI